MKAWSDIKKEEVMKEAVIIAYVESLRMMWCVMCALARGASITSLV
jgi:hypothetical protein